MSTETATDRQYRMQVGMTILDQIGWSAKAAIGYHCPAITERGVSFKARILPFRADGSRSDTPRNMLVEVDLNGADLYEVRVTHTRGSKTTVHYESETGVWGMDYRQLRATIHALDSDGPDALNMDIFFRHA